MSTSKTTQKRTGNSTRSKDTASKKTSQNNRGTKETKGEDQENQPESQLAVLFSEMLQEMYWAEKKLTEALQKMSDAATTNVLQDAFEDHLLVTQQHVRRLEKVFSLMGKPAEAKQCDAMEALVKEGEKIIEMTKDGSMTRDAGLIIAAQKVEHYEIAAYGSLVQVALTLDNAQAASILEKTLWEEEDTDSLLTEIAESDINPRADEEPVDEEVMADVE